MTRILNGPGFESPNFLNEINQSTGEYLWKILHEKNSIARECLVDVTKNQRFTIDEITHLSTNLAVRLQNLNCGSDTVVGIISENRPEFLVALLATFFTGATVTCFNPTYTVGELEHTLSISRPSIVFCSSRNEKLDNANKSILSIQHVILFDNGENTSNSTLLFSNLTKPTYEKLKEVKQDPESSAMILYSSGTTGLPKGVNIMHKNIVFILKLFREENIFGIHKMSTLINFAPMFHAYGFFILLMSLIMDVRIVLMRKFNEIIFLQSIERYKVKILFVVPPLVVFLLKDSRVDDFDLSSVEKIICGAAPLKSLTEQAIRRRLKLRSLVQGYGMTEGTFLCSLRQQRTWKEGSSGSVIHGTQIKIIDIDSREILPPNKSGEVCIRGPQVTKGYYRNEEATAEMYDKEGWLHTGDIGYYDDDGDIFIIDRQKDLIKYMAYQVAPAEIESLLMKHADVQDAGVIGVPNDLAGEIPTAFVVRKPKSTITEKELVQYAAALVSPHKKLRGGVIFIDEIPKNPSGKILRRKLRNIYNLLKSRY